MKPDELAELKAVAPSVRLVECKNEQEAIAQAADADASYGFLSRPSSARANRCGGSSSPAQASST